MNVTIFLDHGRIEDAQTVIDIYIAIQAGFWIVELDLDRYVRRSNHKERKKELPIGTEAEAREVTLVNPARDRMRASFLHDLI